MSSDKSNSRKVEDPATAYKSIPKQKGIEADFDFDKAFEAGLTIEEARAEMHKRIAKWDWKK